MLSSSSSSPAKAELQHLLTTPPPNAPHINPATMAHSALERLRDSGDEHYLFLRALLEMLAQQNYNNTYFHDNSSHHKGSYNSDDELLMFHCVTGVRHVVLHGWRRFAMPFQQGLRDWMMLLGHFFGGSSGRSSNRTLQVACYTTSVALWKRAWLELASQQQQQQQPATPSLDAQQQSLLQAMQQTPPMNIPNHALPFLPNPLALFQYLDHAILSEEATTATTPSPNNSHNHKSSAAVVATLYLQALVEEFAGTKSAVTYQLPLEFHRQTRLSFESNIHGLNACLQLAMKSLSVILPQIIATAPSTAAATIQQQQSSSPSARQQQMAQNMLQIVCDCLEWEFGMEAFADTSNSNNNNFRQQTVLRPPKDWSQHHLTTPALVQILWQTHTLLRHSNHTLAHTVRQVLLLLASLEGPIFVQKHSQERKDFLAAILQGTLELLQVQVSAFTTTTTNTNSSTPAATWQEAQWTELLDTLGILSRLIANGKWSLLIQFHKDPLLPGLLHGLTAIGRTLWEQHVAEGTTLKGDLEMMEYGDMREDVLNQLLEAVVAVTGDPWLWYSGNTAERTWARQLVGQSLGPLYGVWAQGRMQLAGWEEHYLCNNNNSSNDVEEDYEHISAVQLQEEMESLSTLGRIYIKGAIQSLSNLFQQTIPQLQAQWNNNNTAATADVSPELAALLEQVRLLTLYIGHLLTDDNSGETPVIPDVVAIACREEDDDTIPTIVSAIEALFSLAQTQALKLAEQPNDPRLSPLLGSSFLWCLNRWAPAYIYSVDYSGGSNIGSDGANNRNIGAVWSSPEKAQQAVTFAITLCLHFQCYWPQERPVQESAAALLLSLAKRSAGSDNQHHPSKLRTLMVASPAFTQMMLFHCLTAGTRHSMPRSELQQMIFAKASETNTSVDMNMVTGYQRLPYDIKSQILTALLVACSEPQTEAMWQDCLKAVQDAFSSLVHALS